MNKEDRWEPADILITNTRYPGKPRGFNKTIHTERESGNYLHEQVLKVVELQAKLTEEIVDIRQLRHQIGSELEEIDAIRKKLKEEVKMVMKIRKDWRKKLDENE